MHYFDSNFVNSAVPFAFLEPKAARKAIYSVQLMFLVGYMVAYDIYNFLFVFRRKIGSYRRHQPFDWQQVKAA